MNAIWIFAAGFLAGAVFAALVINAIWGLSE